MKYRGSISVFKKSGNFVMPPLQFKLTPGSTRAEILKEAREIISDQMKDETFNSTTIVISSDK